MMTPQEVSQHAFAKASFGGYNMAMVDEFLDALTADYTALYKESAVLKSKMKVLADKLEEYRATDDGMRKAFLLAQKTADDIVAQAELQKAELLKTAEEEARAKIGGFRHELENEQLRLVSAQNTTAAYVAKLKELCRQQVEYIGNLANVAVAPPSPVAAAAQEIEQSVQKLVEEQTAPVPPEEPADMDRDLETLGASPEAAPGPATKPVDGGNLYAEIMELNVAPRTTVPAGREDLSDALDDLLEAPTEDPAEDPDNTSPTRRIDFDNLRFGKDYEI